MREPASGAGASRGLLVGGAALFIVSTAFPVVASVLQLDPPPKWAGIADVVVAAALVVTGMVIVSRRPRDFPADVVETGFRTYRSLANILLILLAFFFVVGDGIRWGVLLPGLAWRAWLLVLVLPSWISLWQQSSGVGGRG